jgi:hypothetical protein
MPSESMPGSRASHRRFPRADDLGEDPCRWLDRDLVHRDPDGDMDSRTWLRVRIDGIDELAVVRGWMCAERWLANEDGREVREGVMQLLRQRERELEGEGDRWERTDRAAARARKRATVEQCETRDADWYRELAASVGPGGMGSTAREAFGSPAEQLAASHEVDDGGGTNGSPLAEELDGLEGQLDSGVATDGGDDA